MSKNRFSQSLTASARVAAASALEHYIEIRTEVPARIKHVLDYLLNGPPPRGRPEKSPSPKGQKPHLTDKQWLALEREVRGYQKAADKLKGNWPSSTPSQTVALAADVSRQMVHKWRKDMQYRRGLYYVMAEKFLERGERMTTDDPDFNEFWTKPDAHLTKR